MICVNMIYNDYIECEGRKPNLYKKYDDGGSSLMSLYRKECCTTYQVRECWLSAAKLKCGSDMHTTLSLADDLFWPELEIACGLNKQPSPTLCQEKRWIGSFQSVVCFCVGTLVSLGAILYVRRLFLRKRRYNRRRNARQIARIRKNVDNEIALNSGGLNSDTSENGVNAASQFKPLIDDGIGDEPSTLSSAPAKSSTGPGGKMDKESHVTKIATRV